MADNDVDRAEIGTRIDVTLVTRGITVTATVDANDDAGLVVRPVGAAATWRASVRPDDAVDVYWLHDSEERTLPATVVSVEGAAEPRWRLRRTGPVAGSRRKAARGRVELPVVLRWSGGVLHGTSVDLSEGGMRALLDGVGVAPTPGSPVAVTLTLEEDITLDLRSQVVWQDVGGPKWLLAVSFLGVAEDDRDALRRRVFRALRDERALIGG